MVVLSKKKRVMRKKNPAHYASSSSPTNDFKVIQAVSLAALEETMMRGSLMLRSLAAVNAAAWVECDETSLSAARGRNQNRRAGTRFVVVGARTGRRRRDGGLVQGGHGWVLGRWGARASSAGDTGARHQAAPRMRLGDEGATSMPSRGPLRWRAGVVDSSFLGVGKPINDAEPNGGASRDRTDAGSRHPRARGWWRRSSRLTKTTPAVRIAGRVAGAGATRSAGAGATPMLQGADDGWVTGEGVECEGHHLEGRALALVPCGGHRYSRLSDCARSTCQNRFISAKERKREVRARRDLQIGVHPTNSPSPNSVVQAGRSTIVSRLRLVAGAWVVWRNAGHEEQVERERSTGGYTDTEEWEKGKKERLRVGFDVKIERSSGRAKGGGLRVAAVAAEASNPRRPIAGSCWSAEKGEGRRQRRI
ncbi:hypothetical protein B0H14DRAFT_2606996 [Mycena olivaceomarginata]|nr:hypothetical protein B0H14DRAFT_2606996 [Mycena olivaceomarginata]